MAIVPAVPSGDTSFAALLESAPPHDIWDDSGKYETIKDRFGQYSDDQFMELADKFWGTSKDRAIQFFTSAHVQTITRDKYNDRGDLGSRLGLKSSIESIGLLLGMRQGPFLVETHDAEKFHCCHWATTIEAFYLAHQDDSKKQNKMVQMARAAGLPHAKTYNHNIPRDGRKFLKEYGNQGNDHITKKTILEVYRESIPIDKKWERRKNDMNWTIASLTYAIHEIKRWEFACSLLPRRWERPRHYEVCHHFAKEAPKVKIKKGPDAGKSVWQALEQRVNALCDLSDAAATNYSTIFLAFYHIFRKLRVTHPHWIVDCCLLMLPAGRDPLAKCALMPNGLGKVPLSKLPEVDVDNLLRPMDQSKIMKELQEEADDAIAAEKAEKPPRNSASKRHCKPAKRAEPKVKAQPSALVAAPMKFDEDHPEEKKEIVFLDVVQDRQDYILKLDHRQESLALGFRYACIYAALNGSVPIVQNMDAQNVKGFTKVIKIFKTFIYKSLKLTPRHSDPDFVQGKFDEDDASLPLQDQDGVPQSSLDAQVREGFQSSGDVSADLLKFLVDFRVAPKLDS